MQITNDNGKYTADVNSSNELKVNIGSATVSVDSIEIKDDTTDTRANVKNDGTNNALVVVQNTVPTTTVEATNFDIRDLDWSSDDIKVYCADECQRILTSDDAVTTVNYASAAKDSVSNIVTSSSGLGRKVTDTFDNSGATTLVISRVVANV